MDASHAPFPSSFRPWPALDPTTSSKWKDAFDDRTLSNAAWGHFEPLLADYGYSLWRCVDPDGPVQNHLEVYAPQTRHGADCLPPPKRPFQPQANEALNEAAYDRGVTWLGLSDFYPMVRAAYDRSDRQVVIRAVEANANELRILSFLNSPPLRADTRNRTIPVLESIHTREWVFVVMPCWNGGPCVGPVYDRVEDYLYAAGQILEGLAFMHSVEIAHMDAHEDNIVLNHFTSLCLEEFESDAYVPFLSRFNAQFAYIDFGFSMRVPAAGGTVPETAFPESYQTVPEIGWVDWVPIADPRMPLQRPDVFHDPYAADVFMVGSVLREQVEFHSRITSHWTTPRDSAQRTHERLRAQVPEYFELIDRMMHGDPKSRPSATAAHAHIVQMQERFKHGV